MSGTQHKRLLTISPVFHQMEDITGLTQNPGPQVALGSLGHPSEKNTSFCNDNCIRITSISFNLGDNPGITKGQVNISPQNWAIGLVSFTMPGRKNKTQATSGPRWYPGVLSSLTSNGTASVQKGLAPGTLSGRKAPGHRRHPELYNPAAFAVIRVRGHGTLIWHGSGKLCPPGDTAASPSHPGHFIASH